MITFGYPLMKLRLAVRVWHSAGIVMNNPVDPRLVWVAAVLAVAVFVVYVAHI